MSSFPRRSRSGDDVQIVPRRTIRSAGSQLSVESDATLVDVVVLVPARVRTMMIVCARFVLVAYCVESCGNLRRGVVGAYNFLGWIAQRQRL